MSSNRKLRAELLGGETIYTLKEAQVLLERWRQQYHSMRPHSALAYRRPALAATLLALATLGSAAPYSLLSAPSC